jgi:acyl-coenzyme A thioesterase PaaI-like protein
MEIHPDLNLPWCQAILNSPDVTIKDIPTANKPSDAHISNTMFAQTLYTGHGIRTQVNFERPTSEPDSIQPWEWCYLISLGTGLDGKTGRAHGGLNALLIDHITGTMASMIGRSFAPATATMTVDYKAPVDTPGVVFCRAWAVERSGRKTWVKATVEAEGGRVLASGKALFIDPKPAAGKL